jgi:beta-lactamase regulating signal transducer with metallopeptidase domain
MSDLFFPWGFLTGTLGVLGILIALAMIALWIWVLVDAVKRIFNNSYEKAIWVLVLLLLPGIAMIAYLILVKYGTYKGGVLPKNNPPGVPPVQNQ